jgi:O-antigen/teichoic acid export membrane protein
MTPTVQPPRRGGKVYFFGNGVAQVAALLRYVVLARLLGPVELGLAATLVVIGAFFDLISDTGSDRFLIQDRDGDTVEVQKLVQLVYVGRGVMIAASLVIFSIPLAHFYHAPRLAAGFAVLALSPLILGFLHLDIRRVQRHLDFRTEGLSLIVSELASLVVTVVAAWLLRNYTAILYGLIARAIIMVAISHLRAERPYGLGYYAESGRRLRRFAGPLVLTGIMLFVGYQGDRVVIGQQLGFKDLGHYSAVLLLVYYPSTMLLRYIHALYVPLVAAGRDDPALRDAVSERLGGQTFLLALSMSVGFAVVAPRLVTLLYGSKFTQSALLVGLIGVLQTTRFLINWPTTVALSMGLSRTVLASNLPRLFVFPAAFVGLWTIGGLLGVVVGFIGGETLSIATALILLNRNTHHSLLNGFDRFAMFVASGVLIVAWNLAAMAHDILWEGGLLFVSIGLTFVVWRREKSTITEAVRAGLHLLRRFQERRLSPS